MNQNLQRSFPSLAKERPKRDNSGWCYTFMPKRLSSLRPCASPISRNIDINSLLKQSVARKYFIMVWCSQVKISVLECVMIVYAESPMLFESRGCRGGVMPCQRSVCWMRRPDNFQAETQLPSCLGQFLSMFPSLIKRDSYSPGVARTFLLMYRHYLTILCLSPPIGRRTQRIAIKTKFERLPLVRNHLGLQPSSSPQKQ
jgi:hypothetical protein